MDILLPRVDVRLRIDIRLVAALRRIAAGRPLIVGCALRNIRGWRYGDLTVGFDAASLTPAYVTAAPVAGVPIAIDRRLVNVLRRGATIDVRSGFLGDAVAVDLDHPEDWLDFLDGRLDPEGAPV